MRKRFLSDRGQAAVEMAFLLPVLMLLMGGVFELGVLMYTYNTLHKSLKSGVHYLQRAQSVNFCNFNDPAFTDAKNFIVFGNLQGTGDPVVPGLTPDQITFYAERGDQLTSVVNACPCGGTGSCDISNGGAPPDYIVATIIGGYPLDMSFPFGSFGIVNLQVTVRLPFLGA